MKDQKKPRRTTLKMVAAAADVSPTLASFVLNGKPGASEKKREKILRIAAELGYQPDPLARELRTGKTQMYGFIVRNFPNPFFNDVLAGMQEAAFEDNITIIAMDSDYSQERERSHIRNLSARRINKLAIAPVGNSESITPWSTLMPNSQIVLVNSSMNSAIGVSHVSPDAVSAVTQAFDHLWELGHRRIGFLSAPSELMSDVDRYATYQKLCTARAVPSLPIFSTLDANGIVQNVQHVLAAGEPPTAIITNSDYSAHYVYIAARSVGVRIGLELSVVGHDDLDTSRLLDPPLTTLALDRIKLGHEVYKRLKGTAADDYKGAVELMVRASTGPVLSGAPTKSDLVNEPE